MRLIAPAKINLHLRVAPLGKDRFHPLMSWMSTVGYFDELELTSTSEPGIKITCDRADLPTDESNLIAKAALALIASAGSHGARVALKKRIPMGGGLGGGSSNGAFALIGLNQLWATNFKIEQLHQIAATLGSDVPFFLHGPSSICTGRGENVKPIARPRPRAVVLIFPAIAMPTPTVYRRFDEMRLGSTLNEPDWNEWANLRASELLPRLVNDLEAPAFSISPHLGQLRNHLEKSLGQIVRMSGSGSTLFTLADELDEARRLAQQAQEMGLDTTAVELAPGSGLA